MATDKKSDFVGDHGGAYIDNNGHRRQFTYIDHDKKVKIPVEKQETSSENLSKEIIAYREALVSYILEAPASLCPLRFSDFTVRGDVDKVKWNKTMLSDPGVSINLLRDIKVLVSKAIDKL